GNYRLKEPFSQTEKYKMTIDKEKFELEINRYRRRDMEDMVDFPMTVLDDEDFDEEDVDAPNTLEKKSDKIMKEFPDDFWRE
ncbi:MAG: hypothetical protein WD876_00705, partial [Candidatus Pacearchaeota archaeon]